MKFSSDKPGSLMEVGISEFGAGLRTIFANLTRGNIRKLETFCNGHLTRSFTASTPLEFCYLGSDLGFNTMMWAMLDFKRGLYTREQITHNSYTPSREWSFRGSSFLVDKYSNGRLSEEFETIRVPGRTYLYLGNPNFGHDFWEVQTRQLMHHRAERWGFDRYAIIEGAKNFEAWLRVAGLSRRPAIEMIPDRTYVFEEVIFAGTLFGRNRDKAILASQDGLASIRSKVQRFLVDHNPACRVPLMYIGRLDANHRRPVNESDLIERVQQCGGLILSGTSLDLESQLDLISRSDNIIAALGAASTITNLAPEATRIIEISPKGIFGAFNSVVGCALLGQEYLRIDCERTNSGETSSSLKSDYVIGENFLHNLSKFLR